MSAQTKTQQETAVPAINTAESKLDIAVGKVVAEIAANPNVRDCTPAEARSMITNWLTPIVERSRQSSANLAYPSDAEMFQDQYSTPTRMYEIFDAVMPHGTGSAAGSAHEAIEAVVLKPERNEYGLIHEQTGSPGYCSVYTQIGVMR